MCSGVHWVLVVGGGGALSVTPCWGVGVGERGTLLAWSAEALALI